MNDFDYDCYIKKKIAQGEKHRVKGKRGCRLPSDNLTEAQRRKLNGECKTVNINEPITYEDYIALPKGLQETYYNHISETFGVGCKAIAEMMGVTDNGLRTHNIRIGISTVKRKGGRSTAANVERFKAFWQGENYDMTKAQPDEPEEATEDTVPNGLDSNTLKGFSIEFKCVDNLSKILRVVGDMPLPKNASVTITVREE